MAELMDAEVTELAGPKGRHDAARTHNRHGSEVSTSAASRRFVAATAERLAELCARPLDTDRWAVVMLDGVHLGEHLLVVALGVTDDGTTVPLGVVEGSTNIESGVRHVTALLLDAAPLVALGNRRDTLHEPVRDTVAGWSGPLVVPAPVHPDAPDL